MNYTLFSCATASLLLALAGCGSSNSVTPTPDQSAVLFAHAAYPQATSALQFTADNKAIAQVAYGQGSSYLVLDAGARTLAVASPAATASATLVKNRPYTFFAYPAAGGTVGTLLVPDDLTPPATGTGGIRLANFATGVPGSGLKLAQATTSGGTTTYRDLASVVSSGAVDAFASFTPSTTSLVLLDDNNTVLAQVGGGTGTGTGVFKYQTGHLYTVLAAGDNTSPSADYKLKAFLLTNL